jgi:hypothetical protein
MTYNILGRFIDRLIRGDELYYYACPDKLFILEYDEATPKVLVVDGRRFSLPKDCNWTDKETIDRILFRLKNDSKQTTKYLTEQIKCEWEKE